ncbi:Doublecortin domain-containing protein 2 [Tupaia chinensis]|uniref:Doublecortin domain-containing protein 2 n=1 Tax=Tupaia chinensis TaxID=246437 RepID=L9L0M9_TUPCH|nr:Doublecortin domain-containing protein 2 [Tupaia chinensis]
MSGTARSSHLSQPVVKSVLVYRNGDPFFAGRRVVIHEKKVSSFDVFLKEVTGGVQAPFGAVRNIYTPRTGHRIRKLDQIQSGANYVAGGQEAFKKLNRAVGVLEPAPDFGQQALQVRPRTLARAAAARFHHVCARPGQALPFTPRGSGGPSGVALALTLGCAPCCTAGAVVGPVIHNSRINVSARFRKPRQEPCTIFLIANGDLISPASRLLIPRRALAQWDHVLQMVTDRVTLRSGAVHRLYTLEGKLVESGTELENGRFYVAVGRDKFKKLPYSELLFDRSAVRRPYGQKASSLPPIVGSRKSKGSGNDRQSKSTIGSSDNSSPQPPKRKGKKEDASSEKPTRVQQGGKSRSPQQAVPSSGTSYGGVAHRANRGLDNSDLSSHRSEGRRAGPWQDVGGLPLTSRLPPSPAPGLVAQDEGVFKAGAERSETRGAAEVQEDEDTQVEVPVDQRPAEIVDEEEDGEKAKRGAEPRDGVSGMSGDAGAGAGGEASGASEHVTETLGHSEEQAGPARMNGGTDEENGEELDQVNNESHTAVDEEQAQGADGQDEAGVDPQRPPRPEVKVTSPQENEGHEQGQDRAVVA